MKKVSRFESITRTRSSVRTRSRLAIYSAASLFAAQLGTQALAQSGTWTNVNSGGNWSDTNNWLNTIIADGVDNTADFSTLNITATNTVHLDTARTVGNLIFGDTTPSNNWALDNNGNTANVLTLTTTSGTPTITVRNQTAIILSEVTGSGGLTKVGPGTLSLGSTGQTNSAVAASLTYTGNTTVDGGALSIRYYNSAGGTYALTTGVLGLKGAIFDFNCGTNTTSQQNVDSLNVLQGASVIQASRSSNGKMDLEITGATGFTRSVGGTLDVATFDTSRTLARATNASVPNGIVLSNGVAFITSGGFADWTGKQSATGTLAAGGGMTKTNATATTLSGIAEVATGVTTTTLAADTTITSLRDNINQASTIDLGAHSLTTGGILVTSTVATAGSAINNGTLKGPANQDLVVLQNSGQPFAINANIADNGTPAALTKGAGGVLILGGSNTFTGGVYLNAGVLQLGSNNALNPTNPAAINFSNGSGATLRTGGNTGTVSALNQAISVPGTPIIENAAAAAGTLVIANTANNTFGGAVRDGTGGGALNITKAGSAKFTLTGATTYTGVTTINSGTLALAAASTNSIASSTVVNIAGGATLDVTGLNGGAIALASGQTVKGSGTVHGLLSASTGTTIAPGSLVSGSSVGTLHADAFTLSSTATLDYEFKSGANDQIQIGNTDAFTLSGGKFHLYADGTTNAWTTPGTYTLFQYAGAVQGTGVGVLNSSSILNPVGGLTYNFSDDTANHLVKLTIGVAASISAWNVDADGNWSTPGNWSGGVPHLAGDNATFGSKITADRTVTLDVDETVGGIAFSNAHKYTIAGTHTLTLDNGTIAAAVTDSLGSHQIDVPVSMTSNTTVTVTNAPDTVTMTGTISGAASLSKEGNGQLVLTNLNNAYTGGTTFTAGTVQFAGLGALGSGNLHFLGGALKWASGNVDDISTRTVTVDPIGATFDTNGNDVVFANAIGNNGAGGITKSGNGKLTLANGNTFSGAVTLAGGTLNISDDSALGVVPANATTAITFAPGAGNTAALQASGAVTLAATRNINFSNGTAVFDTNANSISTTALISGAGGMQKVGDGVLTIVGGNGYTGGTTINGGEVNLGQATGANTNNGGLGTGSVILNGGTLTLADFTGTNIQANNFVSEINVPASATGTLQMSQRATATGALTGSGTLNLNVNFIRGFITGDWSAFTGTLNVNAPLGGSNWTFNNLVGFPNAKVHIGDNVTGLTTINFGAGGTVFPFGELSGTSNAHLLGGTVSGRIITYQVGGLNTSSTWAGQISNSTGQTALSKVGTGTFTITSLQNYSSATTVNGGTLELASGGDLAVTGNVTINNGGTILLNGGTISGQGGDVGFTPLTLTINNGGALSSPLADYSLPRGDSTLVGAGHLYGNLNLNQGTLTVGGTNAAGTFNVHGNGTLNANVNFDLSNSPVVGNGVNDVIEVAGNLDLEGGTTVRVNFLNAPDAAGQVYRLIDYTGAKSGVSANSLSLVTSGARGTFQLTEAANQVNLQVLTISTGNLIWASGNATDNWDVGTTQDWFNTDSNGNDVFFQNDNVMFDDAHFTASTTPTVTLTTVLRPRSFTVNSNTNNYTFSGAGRISGSAGVIKSGSSTMTLSGSNDYSGGTTLNDGSLVIGNIAALGTGPVTLNGGTLNIAGLALTGNALIVPATKTATVTGGSTGGNTGIGAVSGGGILNANNTVGATAVFDFRGDMSAFTGTIALSGTGGFRFNGSTGAAGATWDLGDRFINVRNTATNIAIGALAGSSASQLSGSGGGATQAVTYTIGGANRDTTFSGTLSNGTGAVSIVKTGTATQILAGSNTYTGNTTVQSGVLMMTGSAAWTPALNGPGVTTINGGKLALNYATDTDPATSVAAKLSASYAGALPWTTGQFRIAAPDNTHGLGWKDDSANTKVLVGYTYYGDADLSGTVTTGDFNAVAMHFNSSNLATPGAATWVEGDFNYDGKVNALDFNAVATNFGATAIPSDPLGGASLGTLVPEPASLSMIGLIATALVGRRRRRS